MKQFRALQLVLLYQILVIQSWLQPIGRSWVAISSVSGRYTLEGFNTLRGNPVEAATTSDVRSQSVNSLITKAHCQLIQSPGLR